MNDRINDWFSDRLNSQSEAIRRNPDSAEAYIARGDTYWMMDHYDSAIADYNVAIRLDPENASYYSLRGMTYAEKGDYDKTIADYNKAINLDPEHAMLYLNFGDAYCEMENYELAIEQYDNAVRLCPNYAENFVDRKFRHGGKESVNRAVTLLESTAANPSIPRGNAAYFLALAALFRNNPYLARERFERARELGFENLDRISEHLENLV